MVSGYQVSAAVQVRGEGDGFFDRSERDIPEMQHHICRADRLVPTADELRVHLVNGRERAFRESADPSVTEVGVSGDEVNLVELELRILTHVLALSCSLSCGI